MRNVTITVNETVLTEVRVKAAREGKSLSRYVGELMARDAGMAANPNRESDEALEALFSIGKLDLSNDDGRLPTREEIYDERDEELFRRRQRSSLPGGQEE
jgi:hypothetical protein